MTSKIIKKILNRSALLSYVGYSVKGRITSTLMMKYSHLPVEKNKIVFATTEGRFNDSCKPLAKYLKENNPSMHIIWVCRNNHYIKDFPEYIQPVLFGSKEYYREMSTAGTWVFNYFLPQGMKKRDNQLYIQVWHGDKPFKRIGNDAVLDSNTYRKRHTGRSFVEKEICDLFVNGAAFFVPVLQRSFDYSGKIYNGGLPRNDILLKNNHEECKRVRKLLNIPEGVYLVLYAPTFRDHMANNGDIGTDININSVVETFSKKFNKACYCLIRSHGGKSLHLENTKENKVIIDVTQYPDITDLIVASDALITDYSSCAGDFAYTGRPVILYQDDFESYTTKDRSLLYDMAATPFHIAHNMDELHEIINALDLHEEIEIDRKILQFYESTQTDHATEDIANIIIDHVNSMSIIALGE